MTQKHRMLVGLMIFLTLAVQRLQPTENPESQNLTPFQQMHNMVREHFNDARQTNGYGSEIQIFNLPFGKKGGVCLYHLYPKLDVLVNKAVVQGMRQAAYMNKRLQIYSTEASVEENLYARKKAKCTWGPFVGWTVFQEFEKMAKREMQPRGVDVIIGGYYSFNKEIPEMILIPFVVDKRVIGIRSAKLSYEYKELTISDPITGTLLLRSDVRMDITRSVRQLLEYLPEK